jgi:hypothetical protein
VYCPYCNTYQPDGTGHCSSCGAALSAAAKPYQTASNDLPHYPHPYHKLSGWLLLAVVLGFAGAIILMINAISDVGHGLEWLRSYHDPYGATNIAVKWVVVWFISAFVDAGCGLLLLLFAMKLKNRESDFLQFYHWICLFTVVARFILRLIIGSPLGAFTAVLETMLPMALYTAYFSKSVQVRTYMMSDEYLRRSPLTRNMPSPYPADAQPYE